MTANPRSILATPRRGAGSLLESPLVFAICYSTVIDFAKLRGRSMFDQISAETAGDVGGAATEDFDALDLH
jgi:hypothetical protein